VLAACGPQAATSQAPSLAPSPQAVRPTLSPQAVTPAGSAPAATLGSVPKATPIGATPAPPVSTPAASAVTPPASPAAPCTNDARFVRDVTIPDGMQLVPGQLLVKKWSVTNTGTCDWGTDYRLVLISGDALGAPSAVALYPARAGATGTWEIQMVTPQNPGSYTGKWQARDPAGNLFGTVVFIKIEVIALPTVVSP